MSFQKTNPSGSDWLPSSVSDSKNQINFCKNSRSIVWLRSKILRKNNREASETNWGLLFWKTISKGRSHLPSRGWRKSNVIEGWDTMLDCLSEDKSREKMLGLQRSFSEELRSDQFWRNSKNVGTLEYGNVGVWRNNSPTLQRSNLPTL